MCTHPNALRKGMKKMKIIKSDLHAIAVHQKQYPEDDLDGGMDGPNRNDSGASRVALDGIVANVKRVHVEGLVRTKEDVVGYIRFSSVLQHPVL